MSDLRARIEELRDKAADCELLGNLATDPTVREESRRQAEEYRRMIEEAEALLKAQAA
jgi:hypothetical protein